MKKSINQKINFSLRFFYLRYPKQILKQPTKRIKNLKSFFHILFVRIGMKKKIFQLIIFIKVIELPHIYIFSMLIVHMEENSFN